MREIKFRAFNGKEMIKPYCVRNGKCCIIKECDRSEDPIWYGGSNYYKNWDIDVVTDYPLMQFTDLTTESGQDLYLGDIGEFENGDRFVLKAEDWLEVYVDWIGEPKCEDQARDLYRITAAKVIGNIHMHPELMEQDDE